MSIFAHIVAGKVASLLRAPAPPSGEFVLVPEWDDSLLGATWDGTKFTSAPASVSALIPKAALLERVSEQEWENIELALANDPTDTLPNRKKAARLRARLRRLESFQFIDLTENWVENFFSRLEQDGALEAGRTSTIMSKTITAKERRRGL